MKLLVIMAALLLNQVQAGSLDRFTVGDAKANVLFVDVHMTFAPFQRTQEGFLSKYTSRARPAFLLNETGDIHLLVGEAQLQALAQGKCVTVAGWSVHGTKRRPIKVIATPQTCDTGQVNINVTLARGIELSFQAAYTFKAEGEKDQESKRKP